MKRSDDERYMRLCLELAEKGRGKTSPNPLVGAVVVRKGRILGRGYHRRFGGRHAEVQAIRACRSGARGATLYVNLEPCAHHGKTPPCAPFIAASGVARLVAGMTDPNPAVSGRGFRMLRRAGVAVTRGLLEPECAALNEPFAKHVTTGLPLVTIKVAQSLDGMAADPSGRRRWITGLTARRDAHARRSRADCVLVGAGTVIADDPLLTVRHVRGPQPLRAVLDGNLSVSHRAKIFRGAERMPVLVITTPRAFSRHRGKARAIAARGVTFLLLPGNRGGAIPPGDVLAALGSRGILSLLVEGGPATWSSFLRAGLADRLVVYTAPVLLGGGRRALDLQGSDRMGRGLRLTDVASSSVGSDHLLEAAIRRSF